MILRLFRTLEFGRRMWQLEDLSDEDVGRAMFFKQLQKTGSDFLPLHQQRVVAISVALRTADTFPGLEPWRQGFG